MDSDPDIPNARLVIYSRGMMKLHREMALLSGLRVRYAYGAPPFGTRDGDVIGGWGHKPTARRARRIAARKECRYLSFEDGFLRSVRPGPGTTPHSLIMDGTGVYYDARQPSDLESKLNAGSSLTGAQHARAEEAMTLLRSRQISKYNDAAPDSSPLGGGGTPGRKTILVVDQTYGDASIAGGLAGPSSFAQMLEAACRENPGADILVKSHPEVVNGSKQGYLTPLARKKDLRLLDQRVNPWALLKGISKVYTVSSQLGFEALMAGCPVICFGMPFYAGWGLTDDRAICARRTRKLTLTELVDTVFFGYCRYFDAWRRTETGFFTAVDQLAFLRDHFHENQAPVTGYRISLWKRKPVARMLCGKPESISWIRNPARAIAQARTQGGDIAAWARDARTLRGNSGAAGVDILSIEDGFLRSVGLGVSFTPSASYVFDRKGIYFDPSRESDIESLLERGEFSDRLLARARALRKSIIEAGISKYNVPAGTPPADQRDKQNRDSVLVPGQVADDQSIILGAAGLYEDIPLAEGGANLGLLRAVRRRRPDARILYKPHPDVEAGLRNGKIEPALALEFADQIVADMPIHELLETVDAVETLTSLTGFEALLRGLPVCVHGRPFYAGWGLSDDLCEFPRRRRRLSPDELVAGALILYPRYYDPASGLPCPVEICLENLVSGRNMPPSATDRIRNRAGAGLAWARHLVSGYRR